MNFNCLLLPLGSESIYRAAPMLIIPYNPFTVETKHRHLDHVAPISGCHPFRFESNCHPLRFVSSQKYIFAARPLPPPRIGDRMRTPHKGASRRRPPPTPPRPSRRGACGRPLRRRRRLLLLPGPAAAARDHPPSAPPRRIRRCAPLPRAAPATRPPASSASLFVAAPLHAVPTSAAPHPCPPRPPLSRSVQPPSARLPSRRVPAPAHAPARAAHAHVGARAPG